MRKKINKFDTNVFSNFLYISFTVLVLLLSLLNLQGLKNEQDVQVLGATDDKVFWEELAAKHPTYKDAWIELGRIDKVRQIDPNFSRLP